MPLTFVFSTYPLVSDWYSLFKELFPDSFALYSHYFFLFRFLDLGAVYFISLDYTVNLTIKFISYSCLHCHFRFFTKRSATDLSLSFGFYLSRPDFRRYPTILMHCYVFSLSLAVSKPTF